MIQQRYCSRPRRGKATTIAGRRYRSQLEARWAVWFGLAGWPAEHEPFSLPGWLPDFLLCGETPVLVEVKPTYVFPGWLEPKLSSSLPPHEILVLGCTFPVKLIGPGDPALTIGWLAERSGGDDHTHLWWSDAVMGETETGALDVFHAEGSPFGRVTGAPLTPTSPHRIISQWADAGNKTQWGCR